MRKVFVVFLLWLGSMLPVFSDAPIRIAAFGDSLVHGYGLPPEHGFVPQMQKWLQDHGRKVEMINAGVSGDTTAGGAARIDWTLSDNVDGMIIVLGGNDLLRGIAPEIARANLEAIVKKARAANVEILLVGMDAPGNYGPEYKLAFDAIYPDLAAAGDAVLYENFFTALGADAEDPARLNEVMQSDGIHPNATGVSLIVADMGPKVLKMIRRIGK